VFAFDENSHHVVKIILISFVRYNKSTVLSCLFEVTVYTVNGELEGSLLGVRNGLVVLGLSTVCHTLVCFAGHF
jgi:hypothetical protein